MTRELMFENLVGSIDLYLRFSFMEYEGEEILFLAEDQRGLMYLGVCYEMRGTEEWVLAQTTLDTVQAMVDGAIDVHSAMVAHSGDIFYLVSLSADHRFTSRLAQLSELEPWVLPESGAYLTHLDDRKRAEFRSLRESSQRDMAISVYVAYRKDRSFSLSFNRLNVCSAPETVFNPPPSRVIDQAPYSGSPVNDVPASDAVPLVA